MGQWSDCSCTFLVLWLLQFGGDLNPWSPLKKGFDCFIPSCKHFYTDHTGGYVYPWKGPDLVSCPAVQVCWQLGTRLGLVYKTSLCLELATNSAGLGIVQLAILILRPHTLSCQSVRQNRGHDILQLTWPHSHAGSFLPIFFSCIRIYGIEKLGRSLHVNKAINWVGSVIISLLLTKLNEHSTSGQAAVLLMNLLFVTVVC